MNLGGIKVSSVELERVLESVPNVIKTAAIAVAPGGGPSQLVVYAVCSGHQSLNMQDLTAAMQSAIKRVLNPLFKIHEVLLVNSLPRTPSNKIMRRELRDQYTACR